MMFFIKYLVVLPMFVTLVFVFLGVTRAKRAFNIGLAIQAGVIAALMVVYLTPVGDEWWYLVHGLFIWIAGLLYGFAWWIGLVISFQPRDTNAPIDKAGAAAMKAAKAAANTYNGLSPETQERLKKAGVTTLKGGLNIAAQSLEQRGLKTTAKILQFARKAL